jgi:hypothetical protein
MANADEVYELLSRIAAVTQEPLTYGHLEGITGVPGHFQGSMLKAVQKKCATLDEPDLSTMIVDTKTREVSLGNGNPDPAGERRRCYEFHSRR